MDFDIKKAYKKQYKAFTEKIQVVYVPRIKFIMIDGVGNPNMEEYSLKSKALKAIFKELQRKKRSQGEACYTSPMEGVWDTYDNRHFDVTRKKIMPFTLMMAVPEHVEKENIRQIQKKLKVRKIPYINDVYVKETEEGQSVQLLHRGPYNTDIHSTKKIMEYITVENMKLRGLHHEIYLNNADKVAKKDLKMIVRYAVEEA